MVKTLLTCCLFFIANPCSSVLAVYKCSTVLHSLQVLYSPVLQLRCLLRGLLLLRGEHGQLHLQVRHQEVYKCSIVQCYNFGVYCVACSYYREHGQLRTSGLSGRSKGKDFGYEGEHIMCLNPIAFGMLVLCRGGYQYTIFCTIGTN